MTDATLHAGYIAVSLPLASPVICSRDVGQLVCILGLEWIRFAAHNKTPAKPSAASQARSCRCHTCCSS
jgi:hypothetical protein